MPERAACFGKWQATSISACLISFSLLTAEAIAQQTSIFDECSAALEADDRERAKDLAQTISRMNIIGPRDLDSALRCVQESLNPDLVYDGTRGAFLPRNEVEQLRSTREAASATEERRRAGELRQRELALEAEQTRRNTVVRATAEACIELYRRDHVVALTNPLCNAIFMELGLPGG